MSPIPDDPIIDYHLLVWGNDQWAALESGKRSTIEDLGIRLSRADNRIYAIKGRHPGDKDESEIPFGFYYRGGYYARF